MQNCFLTKVRRRERVKEIFFEKKNDNFFFIHKWIDVIRMFVFFKNIVGNIGCKAFFWTALFLEN